MLVLYLGLVYITEYHSFGLWYLNSAIFTAGSTYSWLICLLLYS